MRRFKIVFAIINRDKEYKDKISLVSKDKRGRRIAVFVNGASTTCRFYVETPLGEIANL